MVACRINCEKLPKNFEPVTTPPTIFESVVLSTSKITPTTFKSVVLKIPPTIFESVVLSTDKKANYIELVVPSTDDNADNLQTVLTVDKSCSWYFWSQVGRRVQGTCNSTADILFCDSRNFVNSSVHQRVRIEMLKSYCHSARIICYGVVNIYKFYSMCTLIWYINIA